MSTLSKHSRKFAALHERLAEGAVERQLLRNAKRDEQRRYMTDYKKGIRRRPHGNTLDTDTGRPETHEQDHEGITQEQAWAQRRVA